jgi:chemotaxis protein CheZ
MRLGRAGGVDVQRKVFRVERMFADRRAGALEQTAGERETIDQLTALRALGARRELSGDQLQRELTLVQETIAHNRREIVSLIGESKERRHMVRAAGELGAAAAGMEKATQKILHTAEAIDDVAKALAATLKSGYERGLAQDIQERTVAIY